MKEYKRTLTNQYIWCENVPLRTKYQEKLIYQMILKQAFEILNVNVKYLVKNLKIFR